MTSIKRQTRRGRHLRLLRSRLPPFCERDKRNLPHVSLSGPPWQRVAKRNALRRRSGACRIGRQRRVINQTGIKVFLLLTQTVAPFEGAQMPSERPQRRTRTRQSHASRIGPRTSKRADEFNHTLICPMEFVCQKKIQENRANKRRFAADQTMSAA